jgi:hypothetical protein
MASTTAKVNIDSLLKEVKLTVTIIEPPVFRFRLWLGGKLLGLGARVLGCAFTLNSPDTWASQTMRSFQMITNDMPASYQLVQAVEDKAAWLGMAHSLYTRPGLQQMLADEVLRRIAYGMSTDAVLARLAAVDGIPAFHSLMEERVGETRAK